MERTIWFNFCVFNEEHIDFALGKPIFTETDKHKHFFRFGKASSLRNGCWDAARTMGIVNSWNSKTENNDGVADIKIDDYMRSFPGDVISRAYFGSNYSKGEEIFLRIRNLINYILERLLYLPIKMNRETRRLEKEINTLILNVVKEREGGAYEKDLLQLIIEGYETSVVTATWTLMLLALYPEWQQSFREEILEICRGQLPNADMLVKMKTVSIQ
ncbi:hypothetical protein PTKIN_Ptkin05aG0171100 [Pterospermum kingtungense]